MTTNQQIIKDALLNLRVLNLMSNPEPTAEQADAGMRRLNVMMADLKNRGADTGWVPLGLTDDFPLPPELEKPVLDRLTLELAPTFSTELTPEAATNAETALQVLQAAYHRVRELRSQPGLDSYLDRGSYDINRGY